MYLIRISEGTGKNTSKGKNKARLVFFVCLFLFLSFFGGGGGESNDKILSSSGNRLHRNAS